MRLPFFPSHCLLAIGCIAAMPVPALSQAPDTVIAISASRSMQRAVQGRPALDIARDALAWTLAAQPVENRIGIVMFGARNAKDCKDIETTAMAPLDRRALFNRLAGAKPVGQAPVADALRAAAGQLAAGKPGRIVLVTDGADTCKGDPCAAAVEVKRSNPGLTVHVVGFDAKSREKLACAANATGGDVVIGQTADDVLAAIGKAMTPPTVASGETPVVAAARKPGEPFVDAPAEVLAGSFIAVPFEGPAEPGNWVGIARKGSLPGPFNLNGAGARVEDGSPGKLTVPWKPGDYEFRFMRNREILFARPVTIKPSTLTLKAPDTAQGGWPVTVEIDGPRGPASFVTIAKKGDPDNARPNAHSLNAMFTVPRLRAPVEAGLYEIRFVAPAGEIGVAARRPLTVNAAPAVVIEPATVKKSTRFEIRLKDAPKLQGDSIRITKAGAPDNDFGTGNFALDSQGQANLASPPQPGDYEMRYVVPGSPNAIIIGRAALTVE